jgi:energy-coupling factor transport system substrate-specific component
MERANAMKRASGQQYPTAINKQNQPAQTTTTWNVGRREVIAAAIGVLLYGFLSHITVVVLISSNTPDIFLPALLIPLLFGAIYGPWTGLIVGGFGFLLGDYIAGALLTNLFWSNGYIFAGNLFARSLATFRDLLGWNGIPGYLANALVGMIAGMATLVPGRRFNTIYALAGAALISSVGVVVATAIAVYSAMAIYQTPYYQVSEATLAFFDTVLPGLLVTLVLLPLLLWGFDALGQWRKGGS